MRVRQVLEQEYLQGPLEDGPAPPPSPNAHRDHLGVTPQRDGRLAVGFAPLAGRISGTQLVDLARLAQQFGRGRLRTTTQQKMLILDVAPDDADPLIARLGRLGLPAEPTAVRAATMACTGIEFCKLAVTETKHRARWLVEELERRLPGLTQQVRIHLNGCPNSCARLQIADIGLQGALVPGPDGHERVEGFLVQLDGHLGDGHAFGRKIPRACVRAADLPDFVEQLARVWLERRHDGETFATWAQREPENELQALFSPPRPAPSSDEPPPRRRATRPGPAEPPSATPRTAPIHCPYCDESDLRPESADPATWRCQTCARVFLLRFIGVRP